MSVVQLNGDNKYEKTRHIAEKQSTSQSSGKDIEMTTASAALAISKGGGQKSKGKNSAAH